ncbi:hypothetical protein CCP3SC1AL1_2430005 [Gammaproteobacteria bacterium]
MEENFIYCCYIMEIMRFLEIAKKHMEKLGYTIGVPFTDKKNYPLGYYMTYKNKWFLLIAFEKFHLLNGKGACKSIDIKIVDEAVNKNMTIVIYIHEPTFEHEPEGYYISPDKIKNWGDNNLDARERWAKFDTEEEREKYLNVPLSQLGIRNLRSDRSRQLYEGEQFWDIHLKPRGFIFIGNQHNDPIYKEIFGYTPDFANFTKRLIIEEGRHSKEEEQRRKQLAEQHGFKIFFIPKTVNYYKKNPDAVKIVLEEIGSLV